jgi:hypothetical protein
MNLAAQIESVQPDVYNKLLSEAYFANIAIFAVREKRLDTEVNKALSGLQGRNGKGGATIEVLMPTLKTALPDTAGPVCILEQKFVVKEQPTVNLGANGTGLTCEQIAVNLAQTFQLFFLGGPMQGFYAAPSFYKYIEGSSDKAFVAIQVVLNATFVLTALQRTAGPAASAAAQTVTLTDQQPGGGSIIYYTTEGSFPGSGNPNATQYTTPFTVASGTIVRTAAYNGTLQGSMVDTFQVN